MKLEIKLIHTAEEICELMERADDGLDISDGSHWDSEWQPVEENILWLENVLTCLYADGDNKQYVIANIEERIKVLKGERE